MERSVATQAKRFLCVAGNAMLRVRVDVYRVVVRSSRNSVSGIRPDLGLRDVALEDVAFSPRRDLDRCGRWLSSREEKHSVGNVFEQSDRVLLRDYGDFRGDFPLRFSPNFRRAVCAFSRIRSRMCWVRVVFISRSLSSSSSSSSRCCCCCCCCCSCSCSRLGETERVL